MPKITKHDADDADASQISNLKQAVQSTLASFLSQRHSLHSDIAQDVFRTIRDESNLLLERQLIFDALDSDPFELMKVDGGEEGSGGDDNNEMEKDNLEEKRKNRVLIARIKVNLHKVEQCTLAKRTCAVVLIQPRLYANNSANRISVLSHITENDDGRILHKNNKSRRIQFHPSCCTVSKRWKDARCQR